MTETNDREAYERAFRDAYEIVDDSASPSEALDIAPADSRLEAAADAVAKLYPPRASKSEPYFEPRWDRIDIEDVAEAALKAADAVAPDIDAMLAEVEPMKEITIKGREGERCFARLFPEHRREGERVGRCYLGTGPTRVAAIADACRKAKAKEVQHGTD